ncbi:hypothetical protein GKZ90_0018725 [Flavobacterium sp. MC2016-06]|jgi:hypothetical protein|uniref:hypothetical protein n=1 Tax=Flavobacterium sp. MC2016-06 TaxID=2676308 RepID=UPI0012BAA5CF|nr:hypothetical protein [Flavobacterium sp. MC2016-06]MBU3861560.1 hypothetical protein [Flavobacterium sp. MC2016-06]
MNYKLFFIILLHFVVNTYAQTKYENKFIDKIDIQIKKNQIKKDSFYNGDSDKIVLYLKSNIPILIKKEIVNVRHTFSFVGNKRIEKDTQFFYSADFYIKNWSKKEYIRIGKIKTFYTDSITSQIMPANYNFDFDKIEIENFITKITKNHS